MDDDSKPPPGETPGWCTEHADLFRNNGAAPEAILDQVVTSLLKVWQERDGYLAPGCTRDKESVIKSISTGQPFCCRLGDAKLRAILVKMSTQVETKKAMKS